MVIDTHAHLHDDKLTDLDAVVNRYLASGVEKVINMGCCLKTSEIGRELSKKYPSVYFAAGYHPSDANDFNEENFLFNPYFHIALPHIGNSGRRRPHFGSTERGQAGI